MLRPKKIPGIIVKKICFPISTSTMNCILFASSFITNKIIKCPKAKTNVRNASAVFNEKANNDKFEFIVFRDKCRKNANVKIIIADIISFMILKRNNNSLLNISREVFP